MIAGASKGRWWSVLVGFGDVYLLRDVLSDWLLGEAANSDSGTFGPLFGETAAWLKNAKIVANLSFVLTFCRTWWTPEMQFCQGIGPWQKNVLEAHQKAGYRTDEYSVRVILMRWRLAVPFYFIVASYVNKSYNN